MVGDVYTDRYNADGGDALCPMWQGHPIFTYLYIHHAVPSSRRLWVANELEKERDHRDHKGSNTRQEPDAYSIKAAYLWTTSLPDPISKTDIGRRISPSRHMGLLSDHVVAVLEPLQGYHVPCVNQGCQMVFDGPD